MSHEQLGDEQQGELVLRSLFDAPVVVACQRVGRSTSAAALDAAWLVGASPERQLELATGRQCAARALAALGFSTAVGRGAHGEPIWPAGAVGSIAHTEGLCVAVAAPASEVLAIGVDVEPDRPQGPAFCRRMCTPAEQAAVRSLPDGLERLAAVVFSAKEASYKLQFPLTHDTECWSKLEVLLQDDCFSVEYRGLGPPLTGRRLRGRFRRALGLIWTGVAVRQP